MLLVPFCLSTVDGPQYKFFTKNIMKIGIIVQVRMGSSRYPGKVLKQIQGKTMLELQYERLKRCHGADTIIYATSSKKVDDPIQTLCDELSIKLFRGSEENVLERYYKAAILNDLDVVIRTNGDCPFIDANEIDKMIEIWKEKYPNYDYISNILEESFPLGMHIEIFKLDSLKRVYDENISNSDREHVTPYIYRNPKKFKVMNVLNEIDLSKHRWTVDYEEDFIFVKEIYKRLGIDNSSFTMAEIVDLIQKEPHLQEINSKFKKKQSLL